jgi:hypothetical protein
MEEIYFIMNVNIYKERKNTINTFKLQCKLLNKTSSIIGEDVKIGHLDVIIGMEGMKSEKHLMLQNLCTDGEQRSIERQKILVSMLL